MSFVRNAFGLLLTRVGSMVVGLGASIILARWLSVEDRGLYSVATGFATLAVLLLQLGWADTTIYRMRRAHAASAEVAGAALLVWLGISVLGVGLAMQFEPWISHTFLDDAPSRVLLLALGLFPFRLLGTTFAALARGVGRFDLGNRYRFGTELAVLVGFVLFLVLPGGGLMHALAVSVLVRAGATVVFVVAVIRHSGLTLRVRVPELVESARFGLKSYSQALAGHLHERIDVFMIAYLLSDPEQVAFYTIATVVLGRLKIVPETMGAAIYPELAGLPPDRAARLAAMVSRQSFALTLGLIAALVPLAGFLIPLLYGEAYTVSVAPLLILLPGMAAHTTYRVLARWFTAVDRQRPTIAIQALSFPLNVALNLWWIPEFGILGAAYASLASYLVEMLLVLAVFRGVTGIPPRQTLVPQRNDAQAWMRRLRSLRARLGAR